MGAHLVPNNKLSHTHSHTVFPSRENELANIVPNIKLSLSSSLFLSLPLSSSLSHTVFPPRENVSRRDTSRRHVRRRGGGGGVGGGTTKRPAAVGLPRDHPLSLTGNASQDPQSESHAP